MLKRTPLFAAHQQLGARLVEFGGWEMPVQYQSIVAEHLAVRQAAGLFDISHMGEILVTGPQAESFLNGLLTNDLRRLAVGQGQYTLMCNQRGGVLDDLYAYRLNQEQYLLVVNASRTEADYAWLRSQFEARPQPVGNSLRDASAQMGAVAVQGPRVAEFIGHCFAAPPVSGSPVAQVNGLKKNQFANFTWSSGNELAMVARTGYTGEDGFEIVAPARIIEEVWRSLLAVGEPFGLQPAGLGARDTLRTEVCYPLYGHELDEQTTPIEAGLGYFVALDKGEFVGRSVLAAQKAGGVGKKCIAFRMSERSAPPRPHYAIWSTGPEASPIGTVTSGTQSPSLGIGVGLGYVPPGFAAPGTALQVEVRGKTLPAVVVPKPIYRKPAVPPPTAAA
jgi:aminomethyltransferase